MSVCMYVKLNLQHQRFKIKRTWQHSSRPGQLFVALRLLEKKKKKSPKTNQIQLLSIFFILSRLPAAPLLQFLSASYLIQQLVIHTSLKRNMSLLVFFSTLYL